MDNLYHYFAIERIFVIQLTPFAISGLLLFFCYFSLLIIIMARGRTQPAKIYGFFAFAVCIWGLGAFLSCINLDVQYRIKIWQFAYSGVLFLPPLFLHLAYSISQKFNRLLLIISYAQAFFFFWVTLSGKMFPTLHLIFDSIYYLKGSDYYLFSFIFWVLVIGIANYELILHYKISYPEKRRQLIIIMLGTPLGFGAGVLNFLPGFEINVYPLGNFIIPLYSTVFTYSIFKHQILDIELGLRKNALYTSTLTLITIFYLLSIFVLEKITQNIFGYKSTAISIITAFFLGLIFIPLRNKIQSLTDKYFLKGTTEEISLQNELLRKEVIQTEKYKTLSTLVSGMAHEIKNPLTSILAFSEKLPEKLNDQEFLKRFSHIVTKEATRINELVHDLLDYGKPSPLQLKPTNINKLIHNTAEFLLNKMNANKINLVLELSSQANAEIMVDPKQIRQAFLNILLNAIDAMPNGGTLTITSSMSNHGALEIQITDTGCGIAPEDITHIFEPFFSKKDNGTGLGLAITQGIIEEHKGKISVKSTLNKKTVFLINIPLKPQ